ncbi:helix-turn-helix domain-containing protein [Rhodobacteraceae bacterium CY05]|uniref:Helix-turn-helix domain-containing protein n=2 Tax=Parasedimentitalea huanghaiensis TaxID=2682100 RepID=A0A6L6WDW2_9RHOB|nr:helix-turn-helix domain-containing protein [Zongyanglinia huanghaiensis]
MPNTAQDRNISSSFAKGLAVLAVFDAQTPSMSLAEIARRTGQDRATARRGALTLVQAGYLRQDGRMLSLTPRVLELAGGFLQANQFGRHVQPLLDHHATILGAEMTLAMLDHGQVLLLAQSTVDHGPVTYGFTPGARIPLIHTSLGRMLLACLPQEQVEKIIHSAEIPSHTEQSIQNPGTILERISQARRNGLVVTDSEFEVGIIGYAVVVSRPGDTPVVVGSSAPRGLNAQHQPEKILRELQLCAAELRQAGAVAGL